MQPVLVHFLDNALSPALLTALSRRPLGVPWYGFARITERLADPGFCRRLCHRGCVMLKLGLESGDQQVLNALDKGIEQVDPVTFSVVHARIEGIMTEMTETILATARNPILHGAKDFTCCLLDTYGASILSMVDCIPVHVGTMSPPLRFIIRAFGFQNGIGTFFRIS